MRTGPSIPTYSLEVLGPRALPLTYLTENDPKGEDVYLLIIFLPSQHLRSHPIWSPDHCHSSGAQKITNTI